MGILSRAVGALLAIQASVVYACTRTVDGTVLIIGRNDYDISNAAAGFNAYGIKWQQLIVPSGGAALPTLNSTLEHGNYGGIVVMAEVAYDLPTGWGSALTTAQWNELYQYQVDFGVRMVRLDVYPTPEFGTTINIEGCCTAPVTQDVAITDTSLFPTANLKTNAWVPTTGLFHYPATITDATIATPIAKFSAADKWTTETVAGVVNKYPTGRQQMVYFTSWASDWSLASNYLQHSFIHFLTRGLFSGKRKTYLSTQVDDVHLATGIYFPTEHVEYRTVPEDMTAHATWQADLHNRLPAGSDFFIELAHNGNGAIIQATEGVTNPPCDPEYPVYYDEIIETAYEWKKPLGTGTDMWPVEFTTYPWAPQCPAADPLLQWFQNTANRDAFAHLSHTFTHQEMNNATFNDANREMTFNIAWMQQVGIASASKFSPAGLVPPAITGLHNGDVIRAWMQNGIKYVVGDNTRPATRNPANSYWALTTTSDANGHDGLVIVPRWATTIYYNCDTLACTTKEWIDTSGGSGTEVDLLNNARETNTRYLLGLHPDPYMFHQANMRQHDMADFTVGSVTGKFSILQIWIETITQELSRLTNWPIVSLIHDDIAQVFLDRETLDNCQPNYQYTYSHDTKKITGATLVASGNSCSVPVPLTVPAAVSTSSGGVFQDTVGSEPTIAWASLSGSPVSFTFNTPIDV
jgi:hypothetical protein